MSSNKKTTGTKEDSKPTLVPKLRFPEFQGAEAWENKVMGSYLVDCSGRAPPDTELPVYSSTREGLKRQDAYFDGRVLQNKNEYGVVPPGCLVYRHMSDDGLFKFNINETGGDIAVSKEYPVFSTKGLDAVFLLAKLNDGPDFKQFALSQKVGGTRTRLYFSRLCEWETLLPPLAEQQKIAECLSSLDERIAAQSRKVDALKSHKKGLMQQLFPQSDETTPRLRFPEFEDAPDWEEKKLGDLVEIMSGRSPSEYELFSEGNHPFVKVEDLNNCGKYQVDGREYSNDFRDIVPSGSILFPKRGAAIENNKIRITASEILIDTNLMALTPNNPAATEFLYYYLVRVGLAQIADTSSIPQINNKHIIPYRVLVPSEAEQQRIADCLASLDDLIAAETQKYEALNRHKRGLMQQLFPSPEGG